jgi:hypothetical protein
MVDLMVEAVVTPDESIGGTDEDLSGTDILGQAMEELVIKDEEKKMRDAKLNLAGISSRTPLFEGSLTKKK